MKLKAVDASFLDSIALPYNCVYSADKLEKDANFPAKNGDGQRAVRVRGAPPGRALDRQALR